MPYAQTRTQSASFGCVSNSDDLVIVMAELRIRIELLLPRGPGVGQRRVSAQAHLHSQVLRQTWISSSKDWTPWIVWVAIWAPWAVPLTRPFGSRATAKTRALALVKLIFPSRFISRKTLNGLVPISKNTGRFP